MGTWNTSILGNDISKDIYFDFLELFFLGKPVSEISKDFIQESGIFITYDDERNNILFGIALAQWETKSLEKKIIDEVKKVITSENDLKLWKDLGASADDIKSRKKVLQKFLKKIETPKRKPITEKSFHRKMILNQISSLLKEIVLIVKSKFKKSNNTNK